MLLFESGSYDNRRLGMCPGRTEQKKDKEMGKRRERAAVAAAILANVIFGFSFMFSRIILETVTPELLLAVRFWIAFLCINGVAVYSKKGKNVPETLRFELKGKPILPLLALGLLQPVLYFLAESHGIARTNATVSGVLIALIPVVATLLSVPFLGERFTWKQGCFVLLSLAGVVLMIIPQSKGGQTSVAGVFLLFGAVVAGAVFNIASRRLRGNYSPFERTYVMMGMGAVVFTFLAGFRGEFRNIGTLLDSRLVLPFLYLGVLSSIGAFLLLNIANSTLPVARTTSFSNLSTLLSLFAGIVILNEPFSLLCIPAAVMILIGVTGVQRAGTVTPENK